MAYPFRLAKPDGLRRLALLERLSAEGEVFTMASLNNDAEREDARWMWRKRLLVTVDVKGKLYFEVTDQGRAAIDQAPEQFQKIREKEEARIA